MVWMLLFIGSIIAVYSLASLYLGWRSRYWPTTAGKVVFSSLLEAKVNNRTVYRPRLLYEYAVDGNLRRSQHIGFYAAVAGKAWAEGVVSPRPEGAEVLVRYHPLLPCVAVLEPGIKQAWLWLLLAVVGGLSASISAAVLFAEDPYMLLEPVFGSFAAQ